MFRGAEFLSAVFADYDAYSYRVWFPDRFVGGVPFVQQTAILQKIVSQVGEVIFRLRKVDGIDDRVEWASLGCVEGNESGFSSHRPGL